MKKFNKIKETVNMVNNYVHDVLWKDTTKISDVSIEQLITSFQLRYRNELKTLTERLEYWQSAEAVDLVEKVIKSELCEEQKDEQSKQETHIKEPVKKKRIIVVKKSEKQF